MACGYKCSESSSHCLSRTLVRSPVRAHERTPNPYENPEPLYQPKTLKRSLEEPAGKSRPPEIAFPGWPLGPSPPGQDSSRFRVEGLCLNAFFHLLRKV